MTTDMVIWTNKDGVEVVNFRLVYGDYFLNVMEYPADMPVGSAADEMLQFFDTNIDSPTFMVRGTLAERAALLRDVVPPSQEGEAPPEITLAAA